MKRDVYLSQKPLEEVLAGYWQRLRDLGALEPARPEKVLVQQSAGRVTAAPVFARHSSPHYHASAMDGIAVRAEDTFGAAERTPKTLRLGENSVMLDTGDRLPENCNAVIMIEDVHFVNENKWEITEAATPWQHVRVIGEDIVATEMIIPANHKIRPIDIGAMLAGGVLEIELHPRPTVGLIPTGTELVKPGTPLKPGDIVEYNTSMFSSQLQQWGGVPVKYQIVPDHYAQLKEQIQKAVTECDLVLVNAGSSAGREDFTADVIRELGTVYTHGVAIKPAKPVILGVIDNKPVMGIPGYPVSAMLALELFVQPLICGKLGLAKPVRTQIEAVVSRKIPSNLGVDEFIRVKLGKVGEKVIATPISRGAGVIMSLVRADGILSVPRLSEGFHIGDVVKVDLLRSPEEIQETTVMNGSHDIALDILGNFLRVIHPGAGLSSAHTGSLGGLAAIKRGEAHAAGVHLLDEKTGDYNSPYVEKFLPDRRMVLINMFYREQGLLVAKGNPKAIKDFKDLTRVHYINRQRGAGTRILFDYKLHQNGIDPQGIKGYDREEYTHMAVAAAVASGSADTGLGIRAAANALGLDFISVAEERYDLCVPAEGMNTPYIIRLLETMGLKTFHEAVKALGGYDLRDCGRVMWQN